MTAQCAPQLEGNSNRRRFLKRAGIAGVGLVGSIAAGPALLARGKAAAGRPDLDNNSGDTAQQIFTAALIAEDLAVTFYYNAIKSPFFASIEDDDQSYVRAALAEEATHAKLLRSLIGGSSFQTDPYQSFYFLSGTFGSLKSFLSVLDELERAFIGAYLAAVLELAQMSADTVRGVVQLDYNGNPYTSAQLEGFANTAASIMAIESEHRVLGRVLGDSNPPNQDCEEQTDGILTVYNGSASAVVALTPFLAAATGRFGLSLAEAEQNLDNTGFPCVGGPPTTARKCALRSPQPAKG